MKIFADCSDTMKMSQVSKLVCGFTTNPTLMRAAGVTNYEQFARDCIEVWPNHCISFEVISDDMMTMYQEAQKISSWGENVYVKIPVITTTGGPTYELIDTLSKSGVKINVTAVFSKRQINGACTALSLGAPGIVSVFAGRIADTGRKPEHLVHYASIWAPTNVEVLWASVREVINIDQAEDAMADIVTVTPDLLHKYCDLRDKDLEQFSKETVQMFYKDAKYAGLKL